MFGLRHVIAMMANSVLVGTFVIFVLASGHYSVPAVVGAIGLGFLLTWPVARLIARWIKIEDPLWDAGRDRPTARALFLRALKRPVVRPGW